MIHVVFCFTPHLRIFRIHQLLVKCHNLHGASGHSNAGSLPTPTMAQVLQFYSQIQKIGLSLLKSSAWKGKSHYLCYTFYAYIVAPKWNLESPSCAPSTVTLDYCDQLGTSVRTEHIGVIPITPSLYTVNFDFINELFLKQNINKSSMGRNTHPSCHGPVVLHSILKKNFPLISMKNIAVCAYILKEIQNQKRLQSQYVNFIAIVISCMYIYIVHI